MSRWLALIVALLAAHAAMADPRPAVVELFTSQGCSSCPPADAFLGELVGRPDVLALAWHVDYWNRLGWTDRFALPEATGRQRAYVQRLGLRTAYTPQMVIDGRFDRAGSDRDPVLALLGLRPDGIPLHLATSGADITAEVGDGRAAGPADMVLVAYLTSAGTPVGRGENAGRHLTEYHLVRAMRVLGQWDGRKRSVSVPLTDLPADSTDAALLLQQPGQGAILGAATASLR